MAWYEIGFWEGDFGYAVADIVCNVQHNVICGASVPRIAAGIHFLAQWDHGDDDESLPLVAEPPTYALDKGPFYYDDYALVINPAMGIVSLYRFAANDDAGHMMPNTCLVCGEIVDYCLGGHDSLLSLTVDDPRTEYERAEDEYDAAYAALVASTENL